MNTSLTAALLATLCATGVQAEVRLTLPDEIRLLSAGQGHQEGPQLVLPDGMNQLLVQYDGVEESRSSGESDRHFRSSPQVLRFEAAGTALTFGALPHGSAQKEAFARQPNFTLQSGLGKGVPLMQDAMVVNGLQIGVDWGSKLAEYNRSGGKAALVESLGTTPAPGAEALPAGTLEGELQRLFRSADPALQRRFIGWAANQL